jgi:hypothetical protein
MTLTDLASLGSFVSGVAVLVSLVYLSLQIRQNTKHSRALIQQGRAGRIADMSLRLAELRNDNGLDKCFEGASDVSAKDLARFLFVCRSIFASAEDSHLQNMQGLLDGAAYESFVASVKAGMASPGVGAAWLLTRDMYEPHFRAFMDETMGDLPGRSSPEYRRVGAWKSAVAQLKGEV